MKRWIHINALVKHKPKNLQMFSLWADRNPRKSLQMTVNWFLQTNDRALQILRTYLHFKPFITCSYTVWRQAFCTFLDIFGSLYWSIFHVIIYEHKGSFVERFTCFCPCNESQWGPKHHMDKTLVKVYFCVCVCVCVRACVRACVFVPQKKVKASQLY